MQMYSTTIRLGTIMHTAEYSLGIFSWYVKYTQMHTTLPCYRMAAKNAKTIHTN